MINLYEYLRSVYEKLLNGEQGFEMAAFEFIKTTSYDALMDDENKCIELISKNFEFDVPKEAFVYNKERAKHIIVTYLLGLGLKKSFGLEEPLDKGIRYNSIWLQSSMLHDYGYFIKQYKDENLSIKTLTSNYNLLTDDYTGLFEILNGLTKTSYSVYFPYEYDEIEKYFEYKKKYCYEKNDHGIVGGCVAFSKYCEAVTKIHDLGELHQEPSISINIQQKIACYTAAAHNIFKSSKKEDDSKYLDVHLDNLLSYSPKRITIKNKLLMLLSLVDTIECTKRFSKRENPNEYLIQKTILENVMIELKDNSLIIDYSNLYKYINKRKNNDKLKEAFEYQMNAVRTIYEWTDFKCDAYSDIESKFIISL